MKNIAIVVLVCMLGACANRGLKKEKVAEPEVTVGELVARLDTAYKYKDTVQLKKYIEDWRDKVQPATEAEENVSEISKAVYGVYKAFYTPTVVPEDEIDMFGHGPEMDKDYLIIQNEVMYFVEKEVKYNYYNRRKKKLHDTIHDFRPQLDITGKKMLYLRPKYKSALKSFLRDTYSKQKDFIANYINLELNVSGNSWHIATYPEVSMIVFNKEMTRAVVHYNEGYTGGKELFLKKEGEWEFDSAFGEWIS